MKNKKATYILIPLVALVWAMIFYRIFSAVKPADNELMQTNALAMDSTVSNTLPDTFSIHANYRDPFLGTMISSERPVLRNTSLPTTPVKTTVIIKSWPVITYGGMIKNQKSNKQLALLQINGESKMMKVGDMEDEVELVKIYKDSIEVMFQKGKRMVRK